VATCLRGGRAPRGDRSPGDGPRRLDRPRPPPARGDRECAPRVGFARRPRGRSRSVRRPHRLLRDLDARAATVLDRHGGTTLRRGAGAAGSCLPRAPGDGGRSVSERYLGTPVMPGTPDPTLTGAVPEHLPARLAVCLWDFSWYTRAGAGEPYESVEQAMAETADRGYNAVRICAAPLLLAG